MSIRYLGGDTLCLSLPVLNLTRGFAFADLQTCAAIGSRAFDQVCVNNLHVTVGLDKHLDLKHGKWSNEEKSIQIEARKINLVQNLFQ